MQDSLRELAESGPRGGELPVPTVIWLHYLKRVKPKWTMEKTWSGREAQQVPAPSPAHAAAACPSISLPTATREQGKRSIQPPEAST